MQQIRQKCYKLVRHNKYKMSMDVIRYFIQQTSLVLLNYGGSTYLNLAKNMKDMFNEYKKTVKIMNGHIYNKLH